MKPKDTYRIERSNTRVSSFMHPSSSPMGKLSSKHTNPSYPPSHLSLKSSDKQEVRLSSGKFLRPRFTQDAMGKLDIIISIYDFFILLPRNIFLHLTSFY